MAKTKYTAVCSHPMCRWHDAHDGLDELRKLAISHSTSHQHNVRVFGTVNQARNMVASQASSEAAMRLVSDTRSGRAVMETIRWRTIGRTVK